MLTNSSKRFVAWVTRFRHKLRDDVFFSVRINITLLILAIGILMLAVFGAITDSFIRQEVFNSVQNSKPASETVQRVTSLLWLGRSVRLTFFLVVVYFLTNIPLKALRKTDAQQKRFVANVTHEFRTPLAVMKTSCDVALRHAPTLSREAALEVINSNLEEIERMSKIMQFFLALSTTNGHMSVQKVPVKLADAVRCATERLQSRAQGNGVTLLTDISDESNINGNATALEEMLTNLIRNAIEHTPPHGKVTIRLHKIKPKRLELLIIDTGVGIATHDLPYIFEPFYRGSVKLSDNAHIGSGLGLSIVKATVQLHRGRITVESTPGKGTVFRAEFPIKT